MILNWKNIIFKVRFVMIFFLCLCWFFIFLNLFSIGIHFFFTFSNWNYFLSRWFFWFNFQVKYCYHFSREILCLFSTWLFLLTYRKVIFFCWVFIITFLFSSIWREFIVLIFQMKFLADFVCSTYQSVGSLLTSEVSQKCIVSKFLECSETYTQFFPFFVDQKFDLRFQWLVKNCEKKFCSQLISVFFLKS